MVPQEISTSDPLRRPPTPPHIRSPLLRTLLATRKQTLPLFQQAQVMLATLAVDRMLKILRMVQKPVNLTQQHQCMEEDRHILTVDRTAITHTLPLRPTLYLVLNTLPPQQSQQGPLLTLPSQAHPRDCMSLIFHSDFESQSFVSYLK